MTDDAYETIVIGTGQGGLPLAIEMANAGKRTAIVERDSVGGCCVNYGCTPTKTMVASARVAHLARRGADYGVRTGPIEIDMETVRRRKRDIVNDFSGGSQRRLERTDNLDLIFGDARFADRKTIDVQLNDGGTRTLTAEQIFINTGLRTARPAVAGLDEVPTLDNASIMELDRGPQHLIVMGGGYVGLEFAQMFRRFGSQVTLFDRHPRLLKREDEDVSEEVAGIFRDEGIEVLLQTETRRAKRLSGGRLRLELGTPDGERAVKGSDLLVAAGRVPATDTLALEVAGIDADERGFIKVNGRLETNVPGVYAMGDVKGGPAFTHISYDDARILMANLLSDGNATLEGRMVPYTIFIDPQLGRVGLTEREAREKGYHTRVAKIPMDHVARALETDETRGFMKAVVDGDTDRILGAAILGIEGGKVMAVLQMAMMGNVPYTAIRDGVFAHPTLAESLNNLFAALD